MAPTTKTEPDPLLDIGDLVSWLKVSKKTILRWVEVGRFPAPVELSKREKRWRLSAVSRYVEAIELVQHTRRAAKASRGARRIVDTRGTQTPQSETSEPAEPIPARQPRKRD